MVGQDQMRGLLVHLQSHDDIHIDRVDDACHERRHDLGQGESRWSQGPLPRIEDVVRKSKYFHARHFPY